MSEPMTDEHLERIRKQRTECGEGLCSEAPVPERDRHDTSDCFYASLSHTHDLLGEVDRLREQHRRDQAEIERLNAEAKRMSTGLDNAIDAMARRSAEIEWLREALREACDGWLRDCGPGRSDQIVERIAELRGRLEKVEQGR